MTVESSYVIEIVTLGDWLKGLSTNEKQTETNRTLDNFPRALSD